jgi:hypothetical protein
MPRDHDSLLGLLLGTESRCLDLSLLGVLNELGLVLADGLLLRLDPPLVEGPEMPSSLESLGSDKTLDLGCFGGGLSVLLGHLTSGCQRVIIMTRAKGVQRRRQHGVQHGTDVSEGNGR